MTRTPTVVLVGNGRIGRALRAQLSAQGIFPKAAYLEAGTGLDNSPKHIDHLIVVITNRYRNGSPKWSWRSIFSGLRQQVETGPISITHFTMVSSTRVYDGVDCGPVYANTPTCAHSEQGQALAHAEWSVRQLAKFAHIVRPAGIYGPNYKKYSAILSESSSIPRFGVHEETICAKLTTLVHTSPRCQTIDLLTDGLCYYGDRRYHVHTDPFITTLAEKHRILIPGQYVEVTGYSAVHT